MFQINEVLLTEKDSFLNDFLKTHTDLLSWIVNGVTHWHFVYMNNKPEKCIYMAGYSENAIPKQLVFNHAFNSLRKKDFGDLLLLLTYYGHMDTESLISKINTAQSPLDALSDFIMGNSSNGYLAYAHQLEQVYAALTGSTMHEAYHFRKQWNKKIIQSRNKASTIQYSDKLKLSEYMEKYSFFDEGPFFLNANFHKAKILFDHLI